MLKSARPARSISLRINDGMFDMISLKKFSFLSKIYQLHKRSYNSNIIFHRI